MISSLGGIVLSLFKILKTQIEERHTTLNFESCVECRVISLDDGVSISSDEVMKYFDTI